MAAPNFPREIPQNVLSAIEGILTDIPGSTIRQDIATALGWSVDNSISIGRFLNGLGLCVENGLLCYTTKDVIPAHYIFTPDRISFLIQTIQSAEYGKDVRYAIAEVLEFIGKCNSLITTFAEDLGLTVVDGKLCAVYLGPDTSVLSEDEAICESIYATPGAQVREDGMVYVGAPEEPDSE